jgi:hypothetical protein
MISSQSRHSARTVRTKRSAYAFACGARIGVWITWMPSLRKISSKAAVELAVAIVDQKADAFEQSGEAEVARLLSHPGTARVSGATCQVDTAACEFNEEEHVEAAQRERLDGEEIASEHARGLLAQELAPARPRASRRWANAVAEQDAPDRARRDTQAELE